MKEIELTKGKTVKVDDSDYERVNQFKWYASDKGKGNIYAYRKEWLPKEKRYKNIAMHRYILGLMGPYFEVDHIDGDTMNNQKENLRVVTHLQNMKNVKIRKGKRFKGVSYCNREKLIKKWRACIQVNNKFINIGYYMTEEEAARAYDVKAKELHGSFARLNFPDLA